MIESLYNRTNMGRVNLIRGMIMDRKYLLTTGEFAKICNTTKETLYYYKEKHIFEPVETGENGYRYYTLDQLCEFDAINILKQVGASIDEIAEYQQDYNAAHFVQLLNTKLKVLEEQEQRIRQMQQFITHNYMLTSASMYQETGIPKVQFQDDEYLIVTPRIKEYTDPMEGVHECLQDHLTYCNSIGLIDRYPLGDMIYMEDALNGKYSEPATISVVTNPSEKIRSCDRFYHKPAGKYLIFFAKGKYDPEVFLKEYEVFMHAAEDLGLTITSNIYEYDVISYLAAGDDNDYVRKYSVKVV